MLRSDAAGRPRTETAPLTSRVDEIAHLPAGTFPTSELVQLSNHFQHTARLITFDRTKAGKVTAASHFSTGSDITPGTRHFRFENLFVHRK